MQTQPEKQEAAPSVATEEKPVDKKKKEKELKKDSDEQNEESAE